MVRSLSCVNLGEGGEVETDVNSTRYKAPGKSKSGKCWGREREEPQSEAQASASTL